MGRLRACLPGIPVCLPVVGMFGLRSRGLPSPGGQGCAVVCCGRTDAARRHLSTDTRRLADLGTGLLNEATAPELDVFVSARTRRSAHDDGHALAVQAASVAHGLNNLLAAVVAQSAVMLATLPPISDTEEQRSGLQVIQQAALDASELTARLLRLGRGQALGGLATAPSMVDLGQIVVDAVELTRSRWHEAAARRGAPIDLAVEIVQPLLVCAVPSDVREIVVNLIVNAVDAMPAGGRLVLRGTTGDGAVVLSCQDDGVGMAPEVLERIFDPFFTTKGEHGTGLGLPIVRRVVSGLGGDVRVASARGVGTTVTLILPAAEVLPRPLEDPPVRAGQTACGATLRGRGAAPGSAHAATPSVPVRPGGRLPSARLVAGAGPIPRP
jgi:signal transduction histidine kinase